MKHLLILAALIAAPFAYSQKLRFKVDGVRDTTVFLAKYYGQKLFYADTAQMKGGVAEFTDKNYKPGIYAFVMPGSKYFEFVYNKEEVSLETKASDLNGEMKVKKSEENKVFFPYIQYITKQRTAASGLAGKQPQVDSISKLVTAYQQNLFKTHPDKLVTKILKMSVEVEIPDFPRDEKGKVKDSTFKYHYYKKHYWDNIDLNDDRLVNTPVIYSKLDGYIGKQLTVQHPDSVLAVAYDLIGRVKPSSEMFRYFVDYITNNAAKSKILGMDKVYVMMADKYYCKNDPSTGKSYAYWMDEKKLDELCKDIATQIRIVPGVVPPNISLRDTTDVNWKNFYSLKSDYTVLYFWDPECGHCKKVTPKLVELYNKKLKARNVEVFAVGKATGDDFEKWKKYIRDNNLNFINVALTRKLYEEAKEDPLKFIPKYTTLDALNYQDTYDIYATPLVILLDKDKKIVAKRLSISQLEDMLDHLQNVKNPVKIIPEDKEEDHSDAH